MVEKRKCQENHKEEKITYCIVKKKKKVLYQHTHTVQIPTVHISKNPHYLLG